MSVRTKVWCADQHDDVGYVVTRFSPSFSSLPQLPVPHTLKNRWDFLVIREPMDPLASLSASSRSLRPSPHSAIIASRFLSVCFLPRLSLSLSTHSVCEHQLVFTSSGRNALISFQSHYDTSRCADARIHREKESEDTVASLKLTDVPEDWANADSFPVQSLSTEPKLCDIISVILLYLEFRWIFTSLSSFIVQKPR